MEKDMVWKRFFSDNERYADLINGIGCRGKQIVCRDDLEELDTQTGIWRNLRLVRERKSVRFSHWNGIRDMLRKVALGINFAVIGVENQEEIDYRLPLRIMSYDIGEYERQAARIRKEIRRNHSGLKPGEYLYGFRKDSRLYPVVTFILYSGSEDWDGALNLHGIIDFEDIPQDLVELVNDYHMHLVEIRKLKNTDVFRTDVRQVFDFIRYSGDSEKLKDLVMNDRYYQDMDEDAFDVVVTYTKAEELIQVKDYHRKDGKVDMCEALTTLIKEGEVRGKAEGEECFAILTEKLLRESRTEDLLKATSDKKFRKELYRELGIEE